MEYLELVEEFKDQTSLSLFDKVKVITHRTRDLYSGKTSKAVSDEDLENRKPTTVAHYEIVKGYIEPNIHEKVDKDDDDYIGDIEE